MFSPRRTLLAAAAAVALLTVSACGSSSSSTEPGGDGSAPAEVKTIGVSTIVSHPDLDIVITGVRDGLKEAGLVDGTDFTVDEQNAQGNISLATTIAQKFVADKVDVVVGISTPSTLAALKATEGSDIPLVFAGVSADPVASGLAKPGPTSLGRLVTGVYTPDITEQQLDLIGQLVPDVKNLGFIYNPGETNSVTAKDMAKSVAEGKGWSLVEATVSSSNDVSAAMSSLIGKVDAVFLPQDNTVITGLPTIIKIGKENKMPVFSSDTTSVKEGAIAAVGVDSYQAGVQAGAMVAKILRGTSANDIPPAPATEVKLLVNPAAAEAVGVTIPQDILDKAEVVK